MIRTRCLSSVLLALAAAGAALADDVRGYVQELDATKGTITLTFFIRGQVSVKSFNLLKPDIPVVNVAGQELKLSDVQAE